MQPPHAPRARALAPQPTLVPPSSAKKKRQLDLTSPQGGAEAHTAKQSKIHNFFRQPPQQPQGQQGQQEQEDVVVIE